MRDTMAMRYAYITSERASEPQSMADTDENDEHQFYGKGKQG